MRRLLAAAIVVALVLVGCSATDDPIVEQTVTATPRVTPDDVAPTPTPDEPAELTAEGCPIEFEGLPLVGVIELDGQRLTVLSHGGNTAGSVSFAIGSPCPTGRVLNDAGGEFGWYALGNACLPDCGLGVTCDEAGELLIANEWFVTAPDADGNDLSWFDIVQDPEVTIDDLVFVTARRSWRLEGATWVAAEEVRQERLTPDHPSLVEFNEGVLCGDVWLGEQYRPASRASLGAFMDGRFPDDGGSGE